MAKRLGVVTLLGALFMTACAGSFGQAIPAVTDTSPSAAEINAAAERAAKERAANDETESAVQADELPSPDSAPTPTATPTEPAESKEPVTNRRVEVGEIGRFPQLLPFDGIRPVYAPEFSPASEAPLDDNELIIGISIDGEAKAYPITVLRFREMVNDEIAGIPTLVTW
jgi:hypothetical protein